MERFVNLINVCCRTWFNKQRTQNFSNESASSSRNKTRFNMWPHVVIHTSVTYYWTEFSWKILRFGLPVENVTIQSRRMLYEQQGLAHVDRRQLVLCQSQTIITNTQASWSPHFATETVITTAHRLYHQNAFWNFLNHKMIDHLTRGEAFKSTEERINDLYCSNFK